MHNPSDESPSPAYFGMLEVALGLNPPGNPTDPTLRNIEGWILSQP